MSRVEQKHQGTPLVSDQDGEPFYTSTVVQGFCRDQAFRRKTSGTLPDQISISWTLQKTSPLWRRRPSPSIEQLKARIIKAWDSISEEEVRNSAAAAKNRFGARVRAMGGHFEK